MIKLGPINTSSGATRSSNLELVQISVAEKVSDIRKQKFYNRFDYSFFTLKWRLSNFKTKLTIPLLFNTKYVTWFWCFRAIKTWATWTEIDQSKLEVSAYRKEIILIYYVIFRHRWSWFAIDTFVLISVIWFDFLGNIVVCFPVGSS